MGLRTVIRTPFPSVAKTARTFRVPMTRLRRLQDLMDGILEGRDLSRFELGGRVKYKRPVRKGRRAATNRKRVARKK